MKWRIGEVMVTKIVELEVTGGSRFILPQATPEAIIPIGWLQPDFADERGRLKMSIHALVVETPSRRIVVDTCLGNDKENRRIPTWNRLQTSFSRRSGGGRLCPRDDRHGHLHASPCRSRRLEYDAGRGPLGPDLPEGALPDGPRRVRTLDQPARTRGHGGSARRLGDAGLGGGLVDLVETDHRICDEVNLVPTLGHTPGHVSVRIASQGEEALITGDFMHHPCQIARPEWSSTADSDPAQARLTRERI